MGFNGKKHTVESKRQIGDSQRGIPISQEHREKIRLGKLGVCPSAEHKAAAAAGRLVSTYRTPQGSQHWNYRGGPIEYFGSGSSILKEWRRQVFERDNWTCQLCGTRAGGELNADHIVPKWADLRLVFAVSNGRTLCRSCHTQTETFGWKAPRRPKEFQLPLPMVLRDD